VKCGRMARQRAVKHDPSKLGRPLAALAEVYRARVTLSKRSAAGGSGAVLPSHPHPTDAASLVASAREAYLRGDFAASVAYLEGLTFVEEPLRTEALFIQSRSLIRLQRYVEVVHLLEPCLPAFVALEEICTARLLHGAAVAFGQDVDRGLELLAAVAIFAESEHVHRSLRGELAYFRSVAHWTKREFAESSVLAIEAERADLDVLSVRATQLRGFIALAQAEYAEALRLFQCAHRAYAVCTGRDVALATQVIYQIAFLEMNLRSADIRGSHAEGRTIPGTSFGPAVSSPERVLLTTADAWLYALDGNRLAAFRKVYEAIRIAPNSAWRVCALAVGANVFQAFGEIGNARILADDAAQLAAAVDWEGTAGEERLGLLRLAEVYASINSAASRGVLDQYDGIRSIMDPTRVHRDADTDPRLAGWDAYVRGLVARVLGEHAQAAEHFRRSANLFSSCGYLWRAALALIELDATPVDSSAERPLERAAIIVRDNFPESFLAARLRWAQIYVDPVGRTLTPAQVDVLRRLLENQPVTVIAAETYRAISTVRKHVEAIHTAFGTHSIVELVLECVRRGILPPGTMVPQDPAALPRVSQA
jgi:tetratricopeptide (TPR) repeat protein